MFAKMSLDRLVVRLQRALLATALLALFFVASPVQPALAISRPGAPLSGMAGAVYLPKIYVGDLSLPGSPLGVTAFTLYGGTGPLVYRSPSTSGAQIIQAVYSVLRWNGSSWARIATSDTMRRNLTSTQLRVRFAAPYLQPIQQRGYFKVVYAFAWFTGGGTRLASGIYFTTSYQCVTTIRLCQPSPNWVRTGGYLTGTW